MDCKNLKVTLEDGSTCTFYEEEDGTQKALFFNGGGFFCNEIVEGSVGELKEGELLKFLYYAGMSSETFESATPIVSIENIEEDWYNNKRSKGFLVFWPLC